MGLEIHSLDSLETMATVGGCGLLHALETMATVGICGLLHALETMATVGGCGLLHALETMATVGGCGLLHALEAPGTHLHLMVAKWVLFNEVAVCLVAVAPGGVHGGGGGGDFCLQHHAGAWQDTERSGEIIDLRRLRKCATDWDGERKR